MPLKNQMSNYIPKSFYSPNDAANILCTALVNLKFKPEAVTLELAEGDFTFLGINLEGEQDLPFLMMLGHELSSIIKTKNTDQNRAKLFSLLQDIGQPLIPRLEDNFKTLKGYVIWAGVPLIKA